MGVLLPPGKKLRPVRREHTFRDFREHCKIKFESMIQACDRTPVLNAQDVFSYECKKKSRANASGNVARAKELAKKVLELIAEIRMNWGHAETTGTMQW